MAKVRIPLSLPNKANSYTIHFNQAFFQAIAEIVQSFKKSLPVRLYWIGPSLAAKRAEECMSMIFRNEERREWLNGESLEIKIWLIKQRIDADGIKVVLDSIQKSGRIQNDRQFRKITVEHIAEGPEPSVEIEVEPLIISKGVPLTNTYPEAKQIAEAIKIGEI